MKIKYDYILTSCNIMIKDKCGNPRDEKEIFEDIFNLWMNTPDSKKDSLATMLAGGESNSYERIMQREKRRGANYV